MADGHPSPWAALADAAVVADEAPSPWAALADDAISPWAALADAGVVAAAVVELPSEGAILDEPAAMEEEAGSLLLQMPSARRRNHKRRLEAIHAQPDGADGDDRAGGLGLLGAAGEAMAEAGADVVEEEPQQEQPQQQLQLVVPSPRHPAMPSEAWAGLLAGRGAMSPAMAHFDDIRGCVSEVVAGSGRVADTSTMQLARMLYSTQHTHLTSTAGMMKELKLTLKGFQTREIRLASATLICAWGERRLLEVSIAKASQQGKLVPAFFCESGRMDETPMPLRTKSQESSKSSLKQLESGQSVSSISDLTVMSQSAIQACTSGISKIGGTSKILHVECNFGYLLSWQRADGQRCLCGLMLRQPRRLFVVDRTTAENLRMALRRANSSSIGLRSFKKVARVVCTDKAGSNPKSEQGFAHDRRELGFGSPAIFDCEVHVGATVHTHVFRRIDDQITGLIRVALSLAGHANMSKFRKIVAATVRRLVRIKLGAPGPEARAWRMRAMYLFGGQGLKATQRLICLGVYPNGDWRLRDTIELYVTEADRARFGDEKLKDMCTHGLTYSLAGAAPKAR